jgi:hypothetical protein
MLTVGLTGGAVTTGVEAIILCLGQGGLRAIERLDEVRPVRGCCIAVPSAHRPVGGGLLPVGGGAPPVGSGLLTVANAVGIVGGPAEIGGVVTFLGPAVTLLGSGVALI